MNDIEIRRPWWLTFVATSPERAKAPTALEDALFHAVERALFSPRHALHRQTFGYYKASRRDLNRYSIYPVDKDEAQARALTLRSTSARDSDRDF